MEPREILTKKTFFLAWVIGIFSGFTIMISGNTLNFWLTKKNIDIKTIGIFSLVSLPYAINFIWAPIFDSKKLPFLHNLFGHRVSWVVLLQILLSLATYTISIFDPSRQIIYIATFATIISFLASAQDTVLGALRTEIVQKKQQGEISGIYIFGYRLGMLVSGSFAIYVSQYISWNSIYKLFASVILFFPFLLIFSFKESKKILVNNTIRINSGTETFQKKMDDLFYNIISSVGNYKIMLLILTFLVLYRLPDNFIVMMINPFLIDIGYNEFEISTVGKSFGIISAVLGGLFASYAMKKQNILDSLFMFGTVHALAHILFIVQNIYGKNIYILLIMTCFESISGGMCMAAYIGYIASLCHGKFRATQYSFFSSMMGLSRAIFPSISGYLVANFGWSIFYMLTTIATIPSLILIFYIKNINKNLYD